MRIDKLLWSLRYFKTRGLATEACKKNKVQINGQLVKASKNVIPTDNIMVRKNQINYSFEVLSLPESRVAAKIVNLFIKNKTTIEEIDKLELRTLSQRNYRDQGLGRPTKKDRRDLDNYIDEEE